MPHQNQKVADKKKKDFPRILVFKINLQLIIMVDTSQLVATGQINRETIKIEKKRWVKIEFWSTPELIAH